MASAAEAAATSLRVLDSSADGASDARLLEAAELLQGWALSPPELAASVPDEAWFAHVLQLIQQHQQLASSSAASSGANAGSGGGGGGSKGKNKRGGSKTKRGASSIAATRKASGPGTQRSVMEWLDSSLDAVLLSEERGIAMDVVMRMRAIADASVRASSADVVEWRELHSSPMPQMVFAELLRECEARSGPQLLPIMAPGPNGLACHPSMEPWGEEGAARAALSRMAADVLPPKESPVREWPPLELVTGANDAVVVAAAARHEEESSELALFVRELGGVCEGWEELAAEARGLAKQCVQPFGDKWQSMLDSFKEDAQLVKQKYDGNKRASKAAQEVRKLELADVMFRQYEEELKQFGTRWLGLFRTSMEDKVGTLLREDAAWLVDRVEGALERVGMEAKEGESPVIPRVRGATITTLKSWKAASKLIRDQWSAALEALEDSLGDDEDDFADAQDGEQPEPSEEADDEESGGAAGFIPTGVKLKWEAATADGWDAKCALLDDKDFRRRLRKAESKASACMRAALQLLESLLGVPCGSGGSSGGSGGGGGNAAEEQQMKGPVDQALITSRKRGSLVFLGAMAVLTTAAGLATSLDTTVTPAMMKAAGVSNAAKGQSAVETTMAEAEAPYREGVVWALDAMDDCIRRSLLHVAMEVASIAPPPPQDGSDQLAGEGETFERIEMGVNPAAQKAAQEAAEEKKRREAERKKKKTAAKNQKRDAERAAQAEAKAKLEAEKRAQAEAERKAAAARKAEAEAQRARAEAERAQKKKEARDLQRQRRQEMQRKQQAEKRAAEQAEAEAAAATAAAAVAVVDDLDNERPMQSRQQQRRQPQPLAQPFVPSAGAPSPAQQPRATATAFEPHASNQTPSAVNAQFENSSYTPEAEEQRRVALAEQIAASDAAAKAKSEVAQLRQTVAVLQQAIVSLPQQSMQPPQQHMQPQNVQRPVGTSMYTGMLGAGDLATSTGTSHNVSMNTGTNGIGADRSGANGSGHLGIGMRQASLASGIHGDGTGTTGVSAPAPAAGTIGGSLGSGYSHQSMTQSGYRQW